ncbi:signal peptidase II [Cereibacter sp. SYSU M97828]|nr:signal peptidase II [Cereibacter flavus]
MVTLSILAAYLALFALGTAGRSAVLFGKAKGADRLAALGFCTAFVLPFFASSATGGQPIGLVIAATGAMIAFAAQMSMGASWRVGVMSGQTGELVTGGLFALSRNPTFLGQAILLSGVALALPSLPTALAVLLFFLSASIQIRSEEKTLASAAYAQWAEETPRWLPYGPWRAMLVVLLADQMTKTAALNLLGGGSIPVLPFFDLTLGFNTGASFGMLSGVMADRPILMVFLTGAITVGLAILASRAHGCERNGYALIAGGAAGNIVDRLNQGAVTDFLNFHWQGWHWPAFNLADVAIVLGAVMILYAGILSKRNLHA